jgi:hypothetical protein
MTEVPLTENIYISYFVSYNKLKFSQIFFPVKFFSESAAAVSAGGVFLPLYPDLDNIGGSPHPGIDRYGICRAVADTGPAFHTGIEVNNPGFFSLYLKHGLGADFRAQPAADTFLFIQHQGGHIFYISEILHQFLLFSARFRIIRMRCKSKVRQTPVCRSPAREYIVSSLFPPRTGR